MDGGLWIMERRGEKTMKNKILVGLLVVGLIGLGVAGGVLVKKVSKMEGGIELPFLAAPKNGTAIYKVKKWDGRMAELTLVRNGKEEKLTLNMLKLSARIPSYSGDKIEPLLSIQEPRWGTAFCEGDEVVLTRKDGEVKLVESKGPRKCKKG